MLGFQQFILAAVLSLQKDNFTFLSGKCLATPFSSSAGEKTLLKFEKGYT